MINWFSEHYIEIFGAITGIIYVFLEIRQTIWLWPLGIITSAIYVWIFLTNKLYADMSLQAYYVIISVMGWYWWAYGAGRRAQSLEQRARGKGQRAQSLGLRVEDKNSPFEGGQGDVLTEEKWREGEMERGRDGEGDKNELPVSRLKLKTGIVLSAVFIILFFVMWQILTRLTDSPVPGWDAFLTSLSIVATWMLARKIYEHWFLWIVVNIVSVALYFTRGLYPTVVLYTVYAFMSFIGLKAWKRTIREEAIKIN